MTDSAEGFDPSVLHVNFTEEEAASKAWDEIVPGKYDAYITGAEPAQCGPDSKNPGKWYYRLEFTFDGGKYDSRKAWTNAMLFSPALYTISQICKAIPGLEDRVPENGGETVLPAPEELIGEPVKVHVSRGKAGIGNGTKENPQYPPRNEPRGFSAHSKNAKTATGSSSLLP